MISYQQVLNAEISRSLVANPPRSALDTRVSFSGSPSRSSPAFTRPALQNAESVRLMQALMASRLAPNRQQVIPQMSFNTGPSSASTLPIHLQNKPATPAGLDLLRTVRLSGPPSPPSLSRQTSLSSASSTPAAPFMNQANIPPLVNERIVPRAPVVARFLSARSQRRMQSDEGGERIYIDIVQESDVLCGRGGKSNHHAGNKRYRQVVNDMKLMYRRTEAKTLKTDLSRAIVEHVCNYGGRFVKRDEKSGRYYLLTKSEARKKTSQALRETKEIKWTA